MLNPTAKKNCLHCGKELQGRVDKKFCDDQCRTAYNNQFNAIPDIVKDINQTLKRNRKILEELTPADTGKTRVTLQKLIDKGFNFSYHTNTYLTKAGALYVFCYDYGYLKLDDQFYMLVKRQQND